MNRRRDGFWTAVRRVRWGRLTIAAVAAAVTVGVTPALLPDASTAPPDTAQQ